MNLANTLTSLRIVLSPLYFLAAWIPVWSSGRFNLPSIIAMWALFIVMELSDLADGWVARKQGIVSDAGKLLDPFADVVARLTYFSVFSAFRIMPVWMFVLIMYRELGIIFVRLMLIRDGVALGARGGGKLKSFVYGLAAAAALLQLTHSRLQNLHWMMPQLPWVVLGLFLAGVVLAWVSFGDYLMVVRRHYRDKGAA